MNNKKLFNRDFSLVVIGQIISLFGNAILRFALPLYLLTLTGSAAVFGTIMAISMVPMALLSPIGGIVADRVNRRNIMVILDFITAGIVILFGLFFVPDYATILIGILMVCLSTIQSFYTPSVQSSIPFLSSGDNLMKANAVVNQVQSLSSLLGPVIGGMLYGFFGLTPIIFIGGISFLFSAIMEIFIHMPFTKQKSEKSVGATVKMDLSESFHFIMKKQPIIFKILMVVCAFNLFITSMFTIGMPTIININLALSSQLYGVAQGLMMAGALLGGLATGLLSHKLNPDKAPFILALSAFSVLPMGLTLLLNPPVMVSYIIIIIFGMLLMGLASIFSVMMLSYVQIITPGNMLGKVMSVIIALSICSQPIG
ncbi:MAG: MFS transporter, partial [Eubacterium sp.]